MLSDLEIAQNSKLQHIVEIAQKLGIPDEAIMQYGNYVAKIDTNSLSELPMKAKLVLVTAIHPTPAGEGKTTISVGLADGMRYNGKLACLALREPSLGPVFGIKGGATGGGMSQVLPMETINLHFTGDLHAITAANNLLAALLDNHIQQGNKLNIDPRTITWHRCLDVNDRQLRNIISGLGGSSNGVPRADSFVITAASQVMATFCLSTSIKDLKENLAKLVVAKTYTKENVTAGDLNAQGAMTALLKDAFYPNLVQSIEGTPCFMHGGPFANIAHGCNSISATSTALKLADYVITEAGFAADLGAEKFFDIKCRKAGIWPNAVVLVATIRALKHQGGAKELKEENLTALEKGMENLTTHAERLRDTFKTPVIVAINKFNTDTDAEIALLKKKLDELNIPFELSEAYTLGGKGASALAKLVCEVVDKNTNPEPHYAYELEDDIKTKIEKLAKNIYGADGVNYSSSAEKIIADLEKKGYGNLPICVAKTQYSFSDDKGLTNVPKGFKINVQNLELSNGAGFIVVFTGDIIAMPGLGKVPAANNIDVDDDGVIHGLF